MIMTEQEFAQFIHGEHQVRKEWLAQAKRMREDALKVEKSDVILATMLRRQALAIEQYHQRLLAYLVSAEMGSYQDDVPLSEEDEREIDALFARVRGKST